MMGFGPSAPLGWSRATPRQRFWIFILLCPLLTLIARADDHSETDALAFQLRPPALAPTASDDDPQGQRRVPSDAAIVDLNHDSIPDLAVVYAFSDALEWQYGQGNATFKPGGYFRAGIRTGVQNDLPRRVVAADFDQDGANDLAVVCSGVPQALIPPSLGIFYGKAEGGLESWRSIPLYRNDDIPPVFAVSLVHGDFNDDGKIDLIAGHLDSRQISVILNQGGRVWAPPRLLNVQSERSGPLDLEALDVGMDGTLDLIVVCQDQLELWRGTGDGNFTSRSVLAEATYWTAAAAADLDHNGTWDLAALDGVSAEMHMFFDITLQSENRRHEVIDLAPGQAPIDIRVLDHDLNGFDDIAVIFRQDQGSGAIYYGHADQTAIGGSLSRFNSSRLPRSLAFGDLNRDQYPDLVIANEGDLLVSGNQDIVVVLNTPPAVSTQPSLNVEDRGRIGGELSPSLREPRGLTWDAASQRLWSYDQTERRLIRFSLPEPGTTAIDQPVPDAEIALSDGFTSAGGDVGDIATDSSGAVWLIDESEHLLAKITSASTVMGRDLDNAEQPSGLAWNPDRQWFFVSSSTHEILWAYSPQGNFVRKWNTARLRDLAWDAETERLWAVPADTPDRVVGLKLGANENDVQTERTIELDSIAPLLGGVSLRAIALDAGGMRLFMLTTGGLLVQTNLEGQLQALYELNLLDSISAATREPQGSILVADGGLLGTIVRFSPNLAMAERVFLLNGNPEKAPVHIGGLARDATHIYVLDSAAHAILVFSPQGQLQRRIESIHLQGRRLQGLYYEPLRGHLFVGAAGVLVEIAAQNAGAVRARPVINAADPWVADHALPVNHPPTSLAAGEDSGGIAVYSASHQSLLFLDENLAPERYIPIFFEQDRPFQGAALIPGDSHGSTWLLAGSGEDNLLRLTLTDLQQAAAAGWRLYR